MAAVTSSENRDLVKYLPDPIFFFLFFEAIFPELVKYLLKSIQNRILPNFIANVSSSEHSLSFINRTLINKHLN